MKRKSILKNEGGMVLVIAMMLLLLLSVMGRSIATTSSIEMKIAGSERFSKKTFFAAEAGVGHIKTWLQSEFTNRNQAKVASGQSPDWDFALKGFVENINIATAMDFDGGSAWITAQALGDGAKIPCNYSVRIWNNPDDKGSITDDTDQLLCVRSIATGPGRTKSCIEVILLGQASGEAIAGYFAQACGGTGKNNNSRDIHAISDFTVQQ